jgi:hypothetical protein
MMLSGSSTSDHASSARILVLAVCLLLSACAALPNGPIIEFPGNNAIFVEGNEILFIANVSGSWKSDISGALGIGRQIRVALCEGNHRVSLVDESGCKTSVAIVVEPAILAIGQTVFVAATSLGASRVIGKGTFATFLYSVAESLTDVELGLTSILGKSPRALSRWGNSPDIRDEANLPLRPQALFIAPSLLSTVWNNSRLSRVATPRESIILSASVGDTRSWRLADPSIGTDAPGYSIEARLENIVDDCEIWIDSESAVDPVEFASFVRYAAEVALPRARSLWGTQYDKNGDGRFSILMSDKLNAGGIAIGFFNPCDFLPFDDDPSSESYNPTSNETDVIYVGSPRSDSIDPAYSPKANRRPRVSAYAAIRGKDLPSPRRRRPLRQAGRERLRRRHIASHRESRWVWLFGR